MTTIAQLAQDVATEFGEEYSDADIASQFHDWTIEVVEEIVSLGKWFFKNGQEQLVLETGTRVYTLDNAVASIRTIWDDTNNVGVPYADVERIIENGYDLLAQGAEGDGPEYWYIDGVDAKLSLQIGIYPVPNAGSGDPAVLEVFTLESPAALNSTSDIPLRPEFLRVAREGIRAKVRANDADANFAQYHENKFQQGLQTLIARFHGGQPQPSPQPVISRTRHESQSPSTPEGR